MKRMRIFWVVLLLGACGSKDNGSEPRPVTYHQDVRPILETHCTGCHQPDNIAPMSFTSYEEAYAYRSGIASKTANREMPPWAASQGCNEYDHDASLTDQEIKLLSAWARQGGPAGDVGSSRTGRPVEVKPIRVDHELPMPVAYTPVKSPDEYRCFLLEWPSDTTEYTTGFSIKPGNLSIVHHVIAFLVDPEKYEEYKALDDADPGVGYECFGGPGGAQAGWLGAWAPGGKGGKFPTGTGIRVEPGSWIALQVHYNTLAGEPAADQSIVQLEVTDQVEHEADTVPVTNPLWVLGDKGMQIPAGEDDVVHKFDTDLTSWPLAFNDGSSFDIYSSGLHMHTLGKSAKLSVKRKDGSETCLVDIGRWDFDWQTRYTFKEKIRYEPGDKLQLECHFDNSAENQAVVDGARRTPQTVYWGEGTFDEMCLGVLYIARP